MTILSRFTDRHRARQAQNNAPLLQRLEAIRAERFELMAGLAKLP